MYVYVCAYIYVYKYIRIYIYIYISKSTYIYVYIEYIYICKHRNQMRISKDGIGCVSPKTASKSNHTMICVGSIHIVRDS